LHVETNSVGLFWGKFTEVYLCGLCPLSLSLYRPSFAAIDFVAVARFWGTFLDGFLLRAVLNIIILAVTCRRFVLRRRFLVLLDVLIVIREL